VRSAWFRLSLVTEPLDPFDPFNQPRRPHRRVNPKPVPRAEPQPDPVQRAIEAADKAADARVDQILVSGLVRRARRIADLSQRELAEKARLSRSTIGRIETGSVMPSLAVLQRILRATDLYLVVVDKDGQVIKPMVNADDLYNGAGRRYPAHLDTILDPEPGEWWADQYGLARPPETFYRDRAYRDAQRARSVWEVRVKQNRHVPQPPNPDRRPRWVWDPAYPRPYGAR
jgi:transcriptional regulator with XRE-family HTH domain